MPKRDKLVTDQDLAGIHLTNPDREMFPGSGVSKLDLAVYFARIGDWMLPDLLERPVTLIRCPSGRQEDCFYQKHAFNGLPDGVEEFKKRDDEPYLSIRTAKGFLALIQFGVVEFHPTDCRIDDLARPDRFIVDLDPGEGVDWRALQAAALMLRERLTALGLTPFVRTTGGKGLHLVTPLVRRQGWDLVKRFMNALVRAVAADAPDRFVTVATKSKRRGRIFLDVGRTALGASAVASYSLRARPDFPAATPLAWEELSTAREKPIFDRSSVVERVETARADPWDDYEAARATITKAARRGVGLDE
jgi:DNA ligase D